MVRLSLDVDEFVQPEEHLAEISQGHPARFLVIAPALDIGGLLLGDKGDRGVAFCFRWFAAEGDTVSLVKGCGNPACC